MNYKKYLNIRLKNFNLPVINKIDLITEKILIYLFDKLDVNLNNKKKTKRIKMLESINNRYLNEMELINKTYNCIDERYKNINKKIKIIELDNYNLKVKIENIDDENNKLVKLIVKKDRIIKFNKNQLNNILNRKNNEIMNLNCFIIKYIKIKKKIIKNNSINDNNIVKVVDVIKDKLNYKDILMNNKELKNILKLLLIKILNLINIDDKITLLLDNNLFDIKNDIKEYINNIILCKLEKIVFYYNNKDDLLFKFNNLKEIYDKHKKLFDNLNK